MRVNSPYFNEISGKLGGAVGMTSRFGMFLRGLVTPNNPQSLAQSIVRGIASSLSSIWSFELTDEQRAGWTQLSEDTPGSADGKALFMRGNSERVRAGKAVVEDAPATSSATFLQFPTPVTADDNPEVSITFPAAASMTDDWASVTGGICNVYVSRPQRATRLTRIKPFVLVDTLEGNTTPGSRPGGLHDISLAGFPEFASMDAGDVVYVKLTTTTADGRRSQDFETRVVVQAA